MTFHWSECDKDRVVQFSLISIAMSVGCHFVMTCLAWMDMVFYVFRMGESSITQVLQFLFKFVDKQ